MYASMPDTITSVMRLAHEDGSLTQKSNHSMENQLNTSSGPPSVKGKMPEALGDSEEGLEK
ncbi:hypothetical protein E2C01_083548 [Portunus trituberculatus]|uniref:Uncharacterized protein n=1 Tax=Portunus trituberculatus TaxID=210409 RepID=A0A5B7IXH2_PORTR|nr:hypothetical protein [Portunus trituberculatus]